MAPIGSPRRSNRPSVRKTKIRKWAEKNVWREVCARELGLIVDVVAPNESAEINCKTKVQKRGRKRTNIHESHAGTSATQLSPIVKRKYVRKNYVFNEHSHPHQRCSNPIQKWNRPSHQFQRQEKFSKRSTMVLNPYNVRYKQSNERLETWKNKNPLTRRTKFRRNDLEANKFVQNETKTKETNQRNMRIPSKLRPRRYVVDKGTPKKRGRKKRRVTKNTEKTSVKMFKNDDENSEIDETWLVEPMNDLPETFVDTIDDIALTNPEFDVDRDLSLERTKSPLALEIYENQSPRESSEESTENRRSEPVNPRPKRRKSADSEVMQASKDLTDSNSITRVTRLSTKNSKYKENPVTIKKCETGTIIWGNCMGWWPGFIVNSEDVGMFSNPGKSWVCWIGEYKISELRDKTQIQPFSSFIEERLYETLRTKTSRDQAYTACLETLELINESILEVGPLTRPHHVWARKNLADLDDIDRLILYPYPQTVQPRLDHLKRTNSKTTEKYLLELKEEKPLVKKESCKSVENKNNLSPVAGHLPVIEQKPGVIAWAKIMGQVWWPAIIIDFRDWGMKEPSFGCQWIVWYGDYTMSQVNHRFFLMFDKGMSLMKDYAKNCKRQCYRRGVLEAAQDYCSRYGYKTEDWKLEDALNWFHSNNSVSSDNTLPGIPGNSEVSQRYPERVVKVLHKHRGECPVAAAREHAIRESEILETRTEFEKLCLMCLENCDEDADSLEHPYFIGRLCQECSEKYKPTIFAYGDDGKCFFCTVCAGSDTVVMCDDEGCPRVYCTACIKYLIAPNQYDEILIKDPWLCFVCSDERTEGSLVPRQDWKERVSSLFRSHRDSFPNQLENYKGVKRKIRVLSLFDGISAGLVVLKKLGIEVEVYYASEIDPDAEMVSSAHHGAEVKRLGDVRSITEEKVQEILPIHLLIGGSPCNDLSLVNPLRLGLHDPNGSGVLFFDYCRIKDLLEKHNGEHFFWMFENVAAMPSKYRLEISKHLGREPELLDSANYSPAHRPRLYWSNLPIVSFPLSSQDLQDVLNPNCNRYALVKKIRTVTTRVNSLKQGREALKPILMNETNDTLWITELEQIFGFPKHYTDVKNLCATKRQRLIAMSWSVQTIVEIMRPLCNFFTLASANPTEKFG